MAQKDKVKHKRRYCRVPDCDKIVKSQGLCQRHGAKTRKCKMAGCEKQAQGNFDGMCKLHFKVTKTQLIAKPPSLDEINAGPAGESVYDSVLLESIGWTKEDEPMPLVKHLKEGFDSNKPRGWHRNEERRSRGLPPVTNPAIQLEGWERELVWMEICLLSGCPQSSFRHLARSWGRDKGFHMVLAQFICERRGNVERKKRIKGDTNTKKSRRAPLELAPSGEDLPNVMEDFDDVDLDMLTALEGCEDPTVNFTHIPDFSKIFKRKRRPDENGAYHHQPLQHHHVVAETQTYAPAPAVLSQHSILHHHQQQHPSVSAHHASVAHLQGTLNHHTLQQQQQGPSTMMPQHHQQHQQQSPMMGGKILTHEALVLDEGVPSQQSTMYNSSVQV